MLVHICCSVDSHYFLQRLKKDHPNKKIIGYFYNPNIHPKSEHDLRLLDVKRSCAMLDIDLIDESYFYEEWYARTHVLSEEPEKGKRCEICFDERLTQSAKKAQELNLTSFTTTLLASPKKSLEKIQGEGEAIAKQYGLEFIHVDYRKAGGTQQQFQLAKEDQLYKQNYCGCFFALNQQRQIQDIPAAELFCSISRQIQPASIESRLALYTQRMELDKRAIPYKIHKNTIQAYRLFSGRLLLNGETVPSYILPYSMLKKPTKSGIIFEKEEIYFAQKENIIILGLDKYNQLAKTNYTSLNTLYFNAPAVESDIQLRYQVTNMHYSLSPIIVLKQVDPNAIYTLEIKSELYSANHETLTTF